MLALHGWGAPEAYHGLVDPFIEEVFASTGR